MNGIRVIDAMHTELPWHPALPFFPASFSQCSLDHTKTDLCAVCGWTPKGEVYVFDEETWTWLKIAWKSITVAHNDHEDYQTEAVYLWL